MGGAKVASSSTALFSPTGQDVLTVECRTELDTPPKFGPLPGGHRSHTIRLWSTTSGECFRTFEGPGTVALRYLALAVDFSRSGREVVTQLYGEGLEVRVVQVR